MKQVFTTKNFQAKTLDTIHRANSVIQDYQRQGYTLTLRQLYYQLVAQDYIPNSDKSYKQLGGIISDARLAGLIDWGAIEDRTRNLSPYSAWDNPAHIIESAYNSFRVNPWKEQPYYVEVWVEKEALAGVVENACSLYRVRHFSCRGYVSQSEMYFAGQRLATEHKARRNGRAVQIIHLGDHDPSGLDMTRDVVERLAMFAGVQIEVQRIALNYDQIQTYNPPPNPAKMTDTRFRDYESRYGASSWELDALPPNVLVDLIRSKIAQFIDKKAWAQALAEESDSRAQLKQAAERWGEVAQFLEDKKQP